jgi:hypothetical protein
LVNVIILYSGRKTMTRIRCARHSAQVVDPISPTKHGFYIHRYIIVRLYTVSLESLDCGFLFRTRVSSSLYDYTRYIIIHKYFKCRPVFCIVGIDSHTTTVIACIYSNTSIIIRCTTSYSYLLPYSL